jgi:high-affinity iron transporter
MAASGSRAAEVSGQVEMPEVCSPGVSPAVVALVPTDGRAAVPAPTQGTARVALVDQRGLQFTPRVQAMPLGHTLRVSNSDSETHSVHSVSPGFQFNQSLPAGQSRDWTPEKAGVVRLVCDIHSHMRGFVVVGASPWTKVCTRQGRFRLDDVPDGRYVLNVWHEMGEPLSREVEVRGSDVKLGALTLTVVAAPKGIGAAAPVRPWSEVIDAIVKTLGSSLDSATRPNEAKKARRLAEDAYWGEFEASDMETAVRSHLGFARKGELEARFFAVMTSATEVSARRQSSEQMADATRKLLLDLVRAADELKQKGVTDRLHIFTATAAVETLAHGDRDERMSALKRAFQKVRNQADRGERDDAASAMTSVYFDEFEPIELFVSGRKPEDVRPLEVQFNAIRGEIAGGLSGDALSARLDKLVDQVEGALGRSDAKASGTFGSAFGASLVLILREGIEVILLLTMLLALVAKTGQAGAKAAVWWGVGLAVVASGLTAWGLNHLVASTQGRAREIVEGAVMLTAAGVLFYVSYWLISKSESRRWMDFLKRQAQRGVELGGCWTLALTAFLAVFREGAETALMYQAMIGAQGQSQSGAIGLAAGLGVGVILLAVIALVIRATSVRLPLRAFFQVSGIVLFGLAVVFAGNGIFELQSSGILKVTPMIGFSWLGAGIPALGLYPTVQTLSVQGILLAGAGLAMVLLLTGDTTTRAASQDSKIGTPPKAGVGV